MNVHLWIKMRRNFDSTLLCSKELASVDIAVDAAGIKDLVLSNDNGVIDASKPFKPFGDFPGTDAGFYIGSKELWLGKVRTIRCGDFG